MKLLAPALAICGGLFLAERSEAVDPRGSDGRNQAMICSQDMVRISASSALEQSLGCAAADAVIRRLAACDIILKRPVSILVSESVRTPHGTEAFGVFDPDGGIINVTALSGLARLAAGTPYATLSPATLYKSVVTHETVHAVMQQNYIRKPSSRAAYEYPAYAIQLELLALEDNGEPNSELFKNDDNLLLSDLILGLDPFVFAARAFRYLRGDSGRCDSLRGALEDRADFIVSLPY